MGLFKKKKKDDPEDGGAGKGPARKEPANKGQAKEGEDTSAAEGKKPKKKSLLKKLIFLLLILLILGGGGFFAYTKFFSGGGSEDGRQYQAGTLSHVNLPEEMLKFCFANMPELYDALLIYDAEVSLFEAEIKRIEDIAAKYPDQQKIADAQKKVWEKGKTTLVKSFEKLEKPIKETFVLFQVNETLGQEKVAQSARQMAQTAQEALEKSNEQTAPLKEAMNQPPGGLIKGTIFKLKKKFL